MILKENVCLVLEVTKLLKILVRWYATSQTVNNVPLPKIFVQNVSMVTLLIFIATNVLSPMSPIVMKLTWPNIVQSVKKGTSDLTVGNNVIKSAPLTTVKHAKQDLLTNAISVTTVIPLKLLQMKRLQFVKKTLVIWPTVVYVILEEIPVFNVSISTMFGIRTKKLVFLMCVLYKTAINVKLILKSVNNVRVEQFHTFQQEDVQRLLSTSVGQ